MASSYRAGSDGTDRLPSDYEEIENATAQLRFQGEAWVNGQALEVDNAAYTYTVPLADLHRELTGFVAQWGEGDREWAIHSRNGSPRVSDCFKRHPEAPEVVQDWNGPFTITLETWGV
jgi:hypothetical protein